MSPTVPLFLLVVFHSLSGSLAAAPTVLLSSTATSLEAGKSANLTCQVDNFEPGVEHYQVYQVYFWRDSDFFCYYEISAPDDAHRSTTFSNSTTSHPSLGRHPISSTFLVYEIMVTPTLAGTEEYWCKLYQNTPRLAVASKHLSITATPPAPLPSVLLSSNLTRPLPSHPFTLTCTLEHFTDSPVKYSLQFFSSRDDLLAVFEVSNGRVLLSIPPQPKVALTQGPKSAFPTFNLVLTEKVDNSTAYWCALEKGKAPVVSNTWPLAVHFTSSKPSQNQRLGTCAVGSIALDLSGKEYSVQFLSDLGSKSVNLLGEYIFKPKLFGEFRSFPVTPWTFLGHGPSTSWPEFSLLANVTGSLQGTWWCVLAVGAQGTPQYREMFSEKATL